MAEGEIIKATSAKVMTWPVVLKPEFQKLSNGTQTEKRKFSAQFVMDPNDPDVATLKKAILGEIKRVFPTEYTQVVAACSQGGAKASVGSVLGYFGRRLNVPLADGTVQADERVAKGKNDAEYKRGKVLLNASSREESPPALGGIENGIVVNYETVDQRAMAASKFYFGAEAFFKVNVKAYSASSTVRGVSAYLQTVVVTGAGERLGPQGGSATEDFGHVAGKVSSVNPVDDEIPY